MVGEVGEAQLMGRKRAAGAATHVRLTTVHILVYPSRRRIPLYMHESRFVLTRNTLQCYRYRMVEVAGGDVLYGAEENV